MDFPEVAAKYKVDRNAPLPTGEPIDKINDQAYPPIAPIVGLPIIPLLISNPL